MLSLEAGSKTGTAGPADRQWTFFLLRRWNSSFHAEVEALFPTAKKDWRVRPFSHMEVLSG